MPRLSLYRPEKGNDYRFLDRTIREMFTIGATDLYIHKYIGSNNPSTSTDNTQPNYEKVAETNIQDLLFQENRDRKYDKDIYRLRGHYNVQNLDFDLSQFGLFLTNDIIFITVHYNDMIDIIGRKLMVGDVFELPHLTDYHPLNESIPVGLRRYYQITDANFASEGFSATWYPHLWRIKCEPLVNTQEFKDILNQPLYKDNYLGTWEPSKEYPTGYTVTYNDKIYTPKQPGPVPPGTLPSDTTYWEEVPDSTLADVVSTYKKNIEINDAIIEEAKRIVPKLGYDRQQLYVVPTFTDGEPALPTSVIIDPGVPAFATSPITIVGNTGIVTFAGNNPMGITNSSSIQIIDNVAFEVIPDTRSGPVVGNPCLYCEVLGVNVGPYGSADSTESRSDQHSTELLTASNVQVASNTFTVVNTSANISSGLPVNAVVYSSNNTPNTVFPPNTIITAYNSVTGAVTVNNSTLSTMPPGSRIVIGGNFDGIPNASMNYKADTNPQFRYIRRITPRSFGWIAGYNSGDGSAPNGEPVGRGIAFPTNPQLGDYFLRTDYLPQKLYRWNGGVWVEIDRNVRTATGFGIDDESSLSTFINNTATITTTDGSTIPSRQGLSEALRIVPD